MNKVLSYEWGYEPNVLTKFFTIDLNYKLEYNLYLRLHKEERFRNTSASKEVVRTYANIHSPPL